MSRRGLATLVGLAPGAIALVLLWIHLVPRAAPLARAAGWPAVFALVVAALGTLALPVAYRRGRRALPGLGLALLASLLLNWLALGPFSVTGAAAATAASLGLWSLLLALPLPSLPAQRTLVRLGLMLGFTLLLLELSLRLLAGLGAARFLVMSNTGAERAVQANRLEPGQPVYGSLANSRGFPDDEFAAPGQDPRPAVALIGDSFVVGIVPPPMLFAQVAERQLGTPVHNLGVRAVGVVEYRWLLHHEALPLDPAVVTVCLFLGNDLPVPRPPAVDRWHPLRVLDPGNSAICSVVRRVAVMQREALPDLARHADRLVRPERLEEVFPWLADWRREPPTMSALAHAMLQRSIVQRLADPTRTDWDALFADLLAMRAACGTRPFALVVIPDESQVERADWGAWGVDAKLGEAAWDAPQQRITAWCRERNMPCLDLSPALRAAPPEPDGRLHVYHLRDTHFNRKGNGIVGAALAEFLRPLLPPR